MKGMTRREQKRLEKKLLSTEGFRALCSLDKKQWRSDKRFYRNCIPVNPSSIEANLLPKPLSHYSADEVRKALKDAGVDSVPKDTVLDIVFECESKDSGE